MYKILQGLQIIEAASFIAAPSCGLHFSQLGADVIRVDTIGGGLDFQRWPLSPEGDSLYWEGLNKGKRSIAINLSAPEGRELLTALIAAPGENRGLFLTNFPAQGFLAYERLKARREDLIVLRVMGKADGGTALDYTVNCAYGVPAMTGPASLGEEPVNHVLPAWDLLAGAYGAFALLAAERNRRLTGAGQEVRVPLDDLAIASLGHLGQIAETTVSGRDRPRFGNDLFGAFGRDFVTGDGRRIMIVALTPRQWSGLVKALGIGAEVESVEKERSVSFAEDQGTRFLHRDRLNPIVAAAIAARKYDELIPVFEAEGVCWGPYRSLSEALAVDPAISAANPLLANVAHRSGYSYLTPGAAATFAGLPREVPGTAPALGQHTEEVLAQTLGLSSGAIAGLHDRKIVASR